MEPVRVISPDLVLVDWGPMTLSISAWLDGEARPVMAALGARLALACLADLADFQGYLKKLSADLTIMDSLPSPVARCLSAAQAVSGELTPLAAVAGAVADEVADYTVAQGADRVIVNNGGDIALRLAPGQTARVGLRGRWEQDGEPKDLSGVLKVDAESGIGGVASSGWGGRSLSPGVADLVTVWAESAALADAAATWIAGCTDTPESGAAKAPAWSVDGETDLGTMQVTLKVPTLPFAKKQSALEQGLSIAKQLVGKGLILGCRLEVQGTHAVVALRGVSLIDRQQSSELLGAATQTGIAAGPI